MSEARGHEYVLRQVREARVKLIALWFSDVMGRLKSVAITDEQLEQALQDGVPFDGGTMLGRARSEETDLLLLPDPKTFAILPWRAEEPRVARMFCDLVQTDGRPCDHDPRSVLKRALSAARGQGYTFYVGCEVEHYYFKSPTLPLAPVDRGGYFDVTPSDEWTDLRRDTVLALEQLGIAVESTHHEVGPGQYEVRLQYSDALSMADALMTHRLVVKQMAHAYGMAASFMPKPLADENGSGLHLHLSLVEEGEDAFGGGADPSELSPVARAFVAGLLEHAPGVALVTNPWVNSYKRLVPGFEAPTRCTWARSATTTWSDLVRVPTTTGSGGRWVEFRAPDPACNPYLALATVLAAGLDGVRRGVEPPAPRSGRGEVDAPGLPRSLDEAATRAERSTLLREVLGAPLTATLVENARLEWRAYHAHVTQWELDRYFPSL